MSNKKLTEERIKELIREMLQENKIKISLPNIDKSTKVDTSKIDFHKDFGSKVDKITKKNFEKLSDLDDSAGDLTLSDLYNAFLEPTSSAVHKAAAKLKKGDPNGDNGFIVKADCYNMIIKDLKPIDELFS